jgi:hypothetical protein
MICGSRLAMSALNSGGGGLINRNEPQTAKLAHPRNVVASGCGRRGSRGLIRPMPRSQPCRRASPKPKRLKALPATRLRATSLHRVAEQPGTYSRTHLMRFTQDGTPTCSRARIASYPVLLAQPAASAIASYDGEALAGRGVVEAPEQRGEHRQRLRADSCRRPLPFSWWRIRARANHRHADLGVAVERHEAAGAKDLLPRADASL